MQFITTVTQKGQVTLPKKMRDKLGIHKYDRVYLKIERNVVKIQPAKDILDLAESFRPVSKKPLLKAREVMERKYKRI